MFYKSDIPSITISNCEEKDGICKITLEMLDSASYIKKNRIIKHDNEVIIMVKKTHTKLFRSSNHIYFPSDHIDSIIIKSWG